MNDGSPMLNLYALAKIPLPPDLEGPNRVISSAHCGYDYTLLLTLTGQLLSAGSGKYGMHCTFEEPGQADPQADSGTYRMDGNELRETPKGPHAAAHAKDRYQFKPIPLEALGGHIVTFVSAGEHHAAIINMNGELWTWGLNAHGQCGVGKDSESSASELCCTPEQPLLLNGIDKKATIVACGGKHTLALASDNCVYAWGNNSYG